MWIKGIHYHHHHARNPQKKSKENPHKTHKIWIQKENPSLNPFLNQNPYQILTPKPIGNHPNSKPMNHKSTHHQPQCFNQSTSTSTTASQSSKSTKRAGLFFVWHKWMKERAGLVRESREEWREPDWHERGTVMLEGGDIDLKLYNLLQYVI